MTTPAPKETVIVVHGTFSAKGPGATPRWYAPGEAFCTQLDQDLQASGSTARCWQHLKPGEEHFHWDGRNDWLSRRNATARLRAELTRLHKEKWRVHLVGHSHGGNVIVDAITNDRGRVEPWFRGRVALLGAPLYRDSRAFAVNKRARATWWLIVSFLIWAPLLYYATSQVDLLAAFEIGSRTELWAALTVLPLGLAVIGLLFRFLSSLGWRTWLVLGPLAPGRLDEPPPETRYSPAFMCINSQADEAFLSLWGLPAGENPFALKSSEKLRFVHSVGAVVESTRVHLSTVVAKTLEVQTPLKPAIFGAAAVVSLLFWRPALHAFLGTPSPGAESLAFLVVLTAICAAAVFVDLVFLPGIVTILGLFAIWRVTTSLSALAFDSTIRNRVWKFASALSLGLNGAPRRVDETSVTRMLTGDDSEDCVYLELPSDIVADVKLKQQQRFTEIQGILYGKTEDWLPTHLRDKFEGLDFPLVHTVYYRDSSCIQKIADWILEPMVKEFDGRVKSKTTVTHGSFKGGEYQTLEDFEGGNDYRWHVESLKRKHGAKGSRWGAATNFDKAYESWSPGSPALT